MERIWFCRGEIMKTAILKLFSLTLLILLVALPGCNQDPNGVLTQKDLEDLKSMKADASWGKPLKSFDTGFNVYKNTPGFENFAGKIISRGGTCLGMCWLVKYYYENVQFEKGGSTDVKDILAAIAKLKKTTIHGAENLREFSTGEEEKMKKVMEVTHLENFAPETIVQSIAGGQGAINQEAQKNLLLENLSDGKLAMIGLYDMKPLEVAGQTVAKKPGNGHCIIAYKSIDFENKTLFFVYDPNVVYNEKYGDHRNYCLLYDKATRKFVLYPPSYKSWYNDLYPNDPTVVSTNSVVGLVRDRVVEKASEAIGNAAEVTEEALKQAYDRMNSAWRNYQQAVVTGTEAIKKETQKRFEGARDAYELLKKKLSR
jgi:hypothetical protein